MSEWRGSVAATIIDINADFDIVLGIDWFKQVQPVPDWSTLDWLVPSEFGTVRIEHIGHQADDARPKLTTLADDFKDVELQFNHISWPEADKILRNGGHGVLHIAKSSDQNLHPDIPRINALEDGVDGLNESFIASQDLALQGLLRESRDVFREELPEGLPPKRSIKHSIDTGSERPVNRNAYPLSALQLKEQAKQVEDLLKRGLIRESSSAWGAPVLSVAKPKTSEWRMCIDYRALNARTVKNAYPIPRIQECIDKLGEAIMVSSIDLLSGY
jgi:hypothetical protein